MTRDEEIVNAAKEHEKGCEFGELVLSSKSRGVNSAYGIGFLEGAEWADSTAWKSADGNDLPEIDKEVIALVWENEHYKVVFAHRPQEYWDGRNIDTGEVTRYYPKRYDNGGWNMPDVKWWLDIDLPKMEE